MSANILETFVNNVQTFSQQGNFTHLVTLASKSIEGLSKTPNLLDNALATLNIQEHSIGVLSILLAKYSATSIEAFDNLFTNTKEFIELCNKEQVRYAGELFAELCHKVTSELTERKMAIKGIKPILKALEIVQLQPTEVTPIHADLCQLCLSAKCMKPAMSILNVDITSISKKCGVSDVRYFLLFYYYGGIIYASNKNFKRATFFFEIAVTIPSLAMSHIMLEAYKKYILVSLIAYGKVLSLPRYTSHVVPRYIKNLCQPYMELTQSFSQPDQDLQHIINKHQAIFTTDNNMGLVKQCLKAHYKRKILCLTKTFLTVSFEDVARRVHLSGADVAQQYLLHMIEDGEIQATIDQKAGMVSFHDNDEQYNTHLTLEEQIDHCIALEKLLKTMDREILLSPQYIQKMSGVYDEEGPAGSGVKLTL